ncbi:MAG: HlyD family efflux transporter periplasmic adaptor subunit [Vicinamibacteraceae bacterium]
MVDIARPESVARKKKMKRIAYAVAGLIVIVLVTAFVSRLKPAAPSVDKATLWPDVVKRGPMVRQVRGTGTLVPEDTRWIPATTAGRVEKILLRSGAEVMPDTVIVELGSPEVEQSVTEARLQMEGAVAQVVNRRAELDSALLTQRADAANIESEARQAQMQAEADEALLKEGLQDALTARKARARADDLQNRTQIEARRLELAEKTLKSQLAVQESEVSRLRATYDLRRQQLEKLKIRAGIKGKLQVVPVEVGSQLAAGANVARVADPGRLKAELRIPETQTRDIEIGQIASIDTRNGFVAGRVSRIDAAATNGTVTVDVQLTGELPRGARPDLTVDGTVELERLDNVVNVGRAAFAQENSTMSLFKVIQGCTIPQMDCEATRTQVKFGRSSVNTIEVLDGLKPGDQVVLSDMSAWDAHDRVRLN